MACHRLIADQLAALADRLPAQAVDELADGLTETYETHLARTGNPDQAARAAIAELGDADTVTAAFIRDSPSRRAALLLVAALLLTIREKRAYRRARLAMTGASIGTLTLDGLMVIFAVTSGLLWPLIIGGTASLIRMALTARGLPAVLRS